MVWYLLVHHRDRLTTNRSSHGCLKRGRHSCCALPFASVVRQPVVPLNAHQDGPDLPGQNFVKITVNLPVAMHRLDGQWSASKSHAVGIPPGRIAGQRWPPCPPAACSQQQLLWVIRSMSWRVSHLTKPDGNRCARDSLRALHNVLFCHHSLFSLYWFLEIHEMLGFFSNPRPPFQPSICCCAKVK